MNRPDSGDKRVTSRVTSCDAYRDPDENVTQFGAMSHGVTHARVTKKRRSTPLTPIFLSMSHSHTRCKGYGTSVRAPAYARTIHARAHTTVTLKTV